MTALPNVKAQASAPLDQVNSTRQRLLESGVRYVFGAYVDVHGVPKSKCVPIEHFADYAAGSELYTVGALEGMGELGRIGNRKFGPAAAADGLPGRRGTSIHAVFYAAVWAGHDRHRGGGHVVSFAKLILRE